MIADYAGARGRLDVAAIAQLSGYRFAVQPKIDGAYCHVVLDRNGAVARVYGRSGAIWADVCGSSPVEAARGLLGCLVGAPHSVLACELESHTEAGNRAAALRGYPVLHAFDLVRDRGRLVTALPYRERRARLYRAHSALQCETDDRPWLDDSNGRAHDRGSGRYTRRIPRGWRRLEIVPQVIPRHVDELWERVTVGQLEGVVVVALDAPVGRRRAKRKVKPAIDLDCTVVSTDGRVARCVWRGIAFTVKVGSRELHPGSLVEVRCDGFYERTSLPRFPRIVRTRGDLRPLQRPVATVGACPA